MTNNKSFSIGIAVISLIGAVLILPGCGISDQIGQKVGEKVIEKTLESQSGGKVDIDSSKQQVGFQTEQGSMIMSSEGNGKLPDNFPSNMFTYSDAKIIVTLSGAKGTNDFAVTYGTNTSASNAVSKYKQEMANAGWAKESELNLDANGSTILSFAKGGDNISIAIGVSSENENLGKTSISITGTEGTSDTGNASESQQE